MNTEHKSFITPLLTFPKSILAAVFFSTLLVSMAIPFIERNPTPFLTSVDHPSRVRHAEVAEIFDNADTQTVVSVIAHSGDIFNTSTLETLTLLSSKIEAMTLVTDADIAQLFSLGGDSVSYDLIAGIIHGGVNYEDIDDINTLSEYLETQGLLSDKDKSFIDELKIYVKPVGRITSIINSEDLVSDEDTLEVKPIMEGIPTTESALNELRQRVMSNKSMLDRIVSKDGKAAIIQVESLVPSSEAAIVQRVYDAFIEIVDSTESTDGIYLAGQIVIASQIAATMENDNKVFFPFVVLVISLVLYISFRRSQAVFIPLLISIVTILWTVALMSVLKVKINVITTSLPVFLITVAVADAIHFISTYYSNLELGLKKQEAIHKTVNHLFMPLLMTTVTSSIGFLSLTLTDLYFIQEFGGFLGFGIVLAFIFTMLLLPPLLLLQKDVNAISYKKPSAVLQKIDELGGRVHDFMLSRSKVVLIFWAGVFMGVTYVASFVVIDNDNIAAFDESTRLRTDQDKVLEHFEGIYPINLWFEAETERRFTDADVIKAFDEMANYIEKEFPEVGATLSLADIVKRSHQVMEGGEYHLPDDITGDMIGQYYWLNEGSSRGDIYAIADHNYKNARMIVLTNTDNSLFWTNFIDKVRAYADAELPSDITLEFTGFGEFMVSNIMEIAKAQVRSISVAVLLIFVLMIMVFRSVVVGFLASLPLVLTLAANFALMVAFDITLNIGTAVVSSIVLGIGIDYSIHYISAVKAAMKNNDNNYRVALQVAFASVLRPISVNTVSLALGFLVLGFSGYQALASVGYLISSTLFICAFLTLFVLPVVFYIVQPKAVLAKGLVNGSQSSIDPSIAAPAALRS